MEKAKQSAQDAENRHDATNRQDSVVMLVGVQDSYRRRSGGARAREPVDQACSIQRIRGRRGEAHDTDIQVTNVAKGEKLEEAAVCIVLSDVSAIRVAKGSKHRHVLRAHRNGGSQVKEARNRGHHGDVSDQRIGEVGCEGIARAYTLLQPRSNGVPENTDLGQREFRCGNGVQEARTIARVTNGNTQGARSKQARRLGHQLVYGEMWSANMHQSTVAWQMHDAIRRPRDSGAH